ncbi:MAG: 2-isopropylmalate synthase [Clostridia bacterium]|nr:2-isopropylmalate synthase [Clostridia bacterium]
MDNYKKYSRGYYNPPQTEYKWMKKDYVDHAPVWCSVDLRDGNQALVVPMNIEKKLLYFNMLIKLGFKEIEVGFPAASETEYDFVRMLIEKNLIPDDVTIQVITPAREAIIKKTLESVKGAKRVIIHMYNPTSVSQRVQVFKKTKDEIKKIAVKGANQIRKFADTFDGELILEYCPESFTGTEPQYALEICNAVLDVWQPSSERLAIINLPGTVELSLPHVYANQVEYISDNINYREHILISVHPHNDRGCSIADAELGLLAGADRVEGTLFGNGERTGNVDLITLAMNMYSHGVNPNLNLDDLPDIIEQYEDFTGLTVNPRHPYVGTLVFAAFSGSHQDAIAKAIAYRSEHADEPWAVPYLPIDPQDIGRSYESDVIRINSQSGKGGIGFVLKNHFGYTLPAAMREHFGYVIKGISDRKERELKPDKIYEVFSKNYLDISSPIEFKEVHYKHENGITATVTISKDGKEEICIASGNGRLDSVANAFRDSYLGNYHITTYEEHSLTRKSDSKAAAYICITDDATDKSYWGVGTDEDIIYASIKGLIAAINNKLIEEAKR